MRWHGIRNAINSSAAAHNVQLEGRFFAAIQRFARIVVVSNISANEWIFIEMGKGNNP